MKHLAAKVLLLSAIAWGLLAAPLAAWATPADDLGTLTPYVQSALDKVAAGDIAGARSAMDAFTSGWVQFEDGVKAESPAFYGAIEAAMGDANFALSTSPPNTVGAQKALTRLNAVCAAFIKGQPLPSDGAQAAPSGTVTMATEMARLDKTVALIDKNDAKGAAAELTAFRSEWVIVEGIVAVKSQKIYQSTENGMARAYGLLSQPSPDTAAAREVVLRMKADLSPYAQGDAHYGIFDAAIILIREGLEAILIVAALLAFLQRSGNGDKRTWVWLGGLAGILAATAAAAVIMIGVSKSGGGNSALMQGGTALFAAAMLLYMSFWLHSKSNLAAWHKYISTNASAAMKKGSLFALALLAFLAVFREGIETVLFYVGMVSNISLGNFAIGVGLGTAAVASVGLLIFVVGVRISVGPFFRVASVLVYYLAFKFAGAGIHAFQLAGKIHVTAADYLPTNGFFGLYPTWETTGVQLAFVAAAAGLLLYGRFHKTTPPARAARVPSNTAD